MHDRDKKDPTGSATEAAPASTDDARSESGSDGGSEDGPLKRITGETRSLFDDLKEWVDLKIQLIQLDFEDRIRLAANQAALTAIVIVISLFALLFGLVAAGEALGAWFDSRSLGFLALAAVLVLVAVVIHLARPRLVEPATTTEKDTDDPDRLSSGTDGRPALAEAGSPNPRESDDRTSIADDGDRRPDESLSAPTSSEQR